MSLEGDAYTLLQQTDSGLIPSGRHCGSNQTGPVCRLRGRTQFVLSTYQEILVQKQQLLGP